MVALAKKTRAIHGRFIGINYESSRNRLAGCFNDAQDWRDAWQKHTTSDKLLFEADATKAGIIRFVKAALELLADGDWLVLQISGHGAHRPDISGVEPDGFNEFFVPYDYDKNVIFDNEWYDLLRQRAAGSHVLFITDCCYSGSMARGISRQHTRPRFVPFDDVALAMRPDRRDELFARRPRSEADGIAEGVVHLSGCADNEVSYDATINRRPNGVMTRYAIDALQQLPRGATFFDWKRELGRRLPSKTFRQNPQWNASSEWFSQVIPGFELPSAEPLPAPSTPPAGMRITLDGWRSKPIEWEPHE